jgi:ribosomal protein L11 methyltransferase
MDRFCKELDEFRDVLRSSGLDPSFSLGYVLIPEQDWNEEWKKSFVPLDAGENLTVLPPWESCETDRIPVIIDPGMAFGTGHHETTKSCLMLIEKFAGMGGKSLLDIGAGTGILAIAASKLGYSPVVGIDIDPLAIEAARKNLGLNDLGNVEMREGTITAIEDSFDVVTANLIAKTLIEIAPDITARLNTGGLAILSGILTGQEEEVKDSMEKAGLTLNTTIIEGKWVTLVCITNSSGIGPALNLA